MEQRNSNICLVLQRSMSRGSTGSQSSRMQTSPSPERFKVSRNAESVTSRLFPQYQVKFEYKSPQREMHSPTRGDKHECVCWYVV